MALIHIDLDDTTVKLLSRICELHNRGKKETDHITVNHLNDWTKNGEFIERFLHIEGLYYNLEIKENAVEVLKDISKRHRVKFLTAYPTAQSAKEKVAFVEKHFPFIGVKNTTLTWNKGDIKGDLLFDDSPLFIPQFEGLKVLFDKPYNQHVMADARVQSWLEFHAKIAEWEKEGIIK